MSETLIGLRRKINGAGQLKSVVRTMKALAASSIGQYERASYSLADYYRTVELGLVAYLRQDRMSFAVDLEPKKDARATGGIVFGSDQGLVGQFNEVVVDFAVRTLSALPGEKKIWAVGDRVYSRLEDAGILPAGQFAVPNSATAITPLVRQILIEAETRREIGPVYVFHNRFRPGATYEPVSQRLLPLDHEWRSGLARLRWPTINLPEVLNGGHEMLQMLIREYLFVSLFKACAESLASENASRLAAMQRAEKNIDDLLEELTRTFHLLRQSSIDEELFDVISGFEALSSQTNSAMALHRQT